MFLYVVAGKLQVNMSGFHLSGVEDYDSEEKSEKDSVVGFSIDKTVSDALNPYVQVSRIFCYDIYTPMCV